MIVAKINAKHEMLVQDLADTDKKMYKLSETTMTLSTAGEKLLNNMGKEKIYIN